MANFSSKIFKVLAFIVLALFSFSAVANDENYAFSRFGQVKYPADFTHFDYVNPDAPKGGTMRHVAIGTFDNLNPYILKGVAAAGVGRVYDSLMVASNDELFSYYGLLAESIKVADDNSAVTFKLRKEARWHDNTPVTADDIVFSFEKIMEEGHPYFQSYYRDVSGAEKISDLEVKFLFANKDNKELPLIIGQFPVISKAYYAKNEFNKTTLEPPLGNGAYKIAEVQAGRSIKYERVKNYWGKDLPVNKGRYNFDVIKYEYFRDATVAIEGLKGEQYDLRQENISKVWATSYESLPALKEGRLIKEEIPHEIPTGMQAFVFNTRLPKFADINIRKALNYIFDFEWTNKQLFYGSYARNDSYFTNSVYAARGIPQGKELELLLAYKEQLPEELFTKKFSVPKTDGSGNIRNNLRKAGNILTDSGFKIVDKKRIDPNTGRQMTITFLLVSPAFERVVAPMIKNLQRLGVDAKMRIVDSSQYQKRLDDFDYDIIVYSLGQSNSPGNEQIDYWHSSKTNIKGSKNYIGVNNKIVDNLIEKILAAESQEDLIAATQAMDRVLLWNYYVIPNWHIRGFRLIYWDKFERPEVSPRYALGLENWWSK
jgi:microcin C transport system substrate-binding protein